MNLNKVSRDPLALGYQSSPVALPVQHCLILRQRRWALMSLDPAATWWMLGAMSRVASRCCSIAVEMLTVISLIGPIVAVMRLIAATASRVEACIAASCAEMSSVALAV